MRIPHIQSISCLRRREKLRWFIHNKLNISVDALTKSSRATIHCEVIFDELKLLSINRVIFEYREELFYANVHERNDVLRDRAVVRKDVSEEGKLTENAIFLYFADYRHRLFGGFSHIQTEVNCAIHHEEEFIRWFVFSKNDLLWPMTLLLHFWSKVSEEFLREVKLEQFLRVKNLSINI